MTTPMIPTTLDLSAAIFRQLDETTCAGLRDFLERAARTDPGERQALHIKALYVDLRDAMKKGDESVDFDRKREVDGRKPS